MSNKLEIIETRIVNKVTLKDSDSDMLKYSIVFTDNSNNNTPELCMLFHDKDRESAMAIAVEDVDDFCDALKALKKTAVERFNKHNGIK